MLRQAARSPYAHLRWKSPDYSLQTCKESGRICITTSLGVVFSYDFAYLGIGGLAGVAGISVYWNRSQNDQRKMDRLISRCKSSAACRIVLLKHFPDDCRRNAFHWSESEFEIRFGDLYRAGTRTQTILRRGQTLKNQAPYGGDTAKQQSNLQCSKHFVPLFRAWNQVRPGTLEWSQYWSSSE